MKTFCLEIENTRDPLAIYNTLRKDTSNSFLFESKEKTRTGRYSFIGIDPKAILRFDSHVRIEGTGPVFDLAVEHATEDPLETLKEIFTRLEPGKDDLLAAGFLSYDYVRLIEKIPDRHKSNGEPIAFFMILPDMVILDHLEKKIKIHTSGDNAEEQASRIAAKISVISGIKTKFKASKKLQYKTNTTKEQYLTAVNTAKQYIRQGHAVQVVLSKKYETEFRKDPFTAYLALRRINPSPYLYYLETADLKIAGSSPETLVKMQEGIAYTRPIAGTAKRGASEKEDIELEQKLLSDEKELAEHAMRVDLARNDLGKVCEYGTISPIELLQVQKFSHVQHITSTIKGKAKTDCFQTLKACFPAGTVSGAPKIRAMEIIDELENEKRGIYAGCIGYFTLDGDMDTAIAIRTIIFRDGKAIVQAGAGIVADSVPEKENKEVENKAKAMLLALELAEGSEQLIGDGK